MRKFNVPFLGHFSTALLRVLLLAVVVSSSVFMSSTMTYAQDGNITIEQRDISIETSGQIIPEGCALNESNEVVCPENTQPYSDSALLSALDVLLDEIHAFLYAISGSIIFIFVIIAAIRISRKLLGVN